MTVPAKKTRRKLRYASDPSQHAQIDFDPQGDSFHPDIPALVCNESFNGCCVVAVKEKHLKEGSKIRIKVGDLAPMLGEIKWITDLDVEVLKIGVEFLE